MIKLTSRAISIFLFFGFCYFFNSNINAQGIETLKKKALAHMDAGRYGEAISLWNNFITQQPQNPEGYFYRGEAYEHRGQFEDARVNYERAIKLDYNNTKPEYRTIYNNMIASWYSQLRRQISGYRREIAIDSSKSENYLAIGKNYRLMREWEDAELWYKKYIAREGKISADELIRFSHILEANKKIRESQTILKEYLDYYPTDWRLYSRYGYMSLWLGENKKAADAFEKALEIKPYFKEAEEGLERARREGIVETTLQPSRIKESPIDRYYRILRSKPDNVEMRYKLLDELMKAKRWEEAVGQLELLSRTEYNKDRYLEKSEIVYSTREEEYRAKIDEAMAILEEEPLNKDAIKQAASYHEYLQEYDEAYGILEYYFEEAPNDRDESLRFQYAKIAAWSGNFANAKIILDSLLIAKPKNLDYQLFRSQVSVWTNTDLDRAGVYLNNVISARPNDIDVIITMGSYLVNVKKFDEAQKYADRAAAIDASNLDLIQLQSNIDFQKMRAEEERLFLILEKGRKLVQHDSCKEALAYYESYLDQAEPNNLIVKEYGDIQFCAKNYKKALGIYDDLLEEGYNYDIALQRAKLFFAMNDSTGAVTAFERVVSNSPKGFEGNLFLADAYAKVKRNDDAINILDTLETWDLDSVQTSLVEQRMKWIPASGLKGIIERFPTFISFAPSGTFYSDNLTFRYQNFGGRFDFGLTPYITLGISFNRIILRSESQGVRYFNSFRWHTNLSITKALSAGFSFGTLNSQGIPSVDELELIATYKIGKRFSLLGNYLNTDGGVLLYSPNLIDKRYQYQTQMYKVQGDYVHSSGVKIVGSYQYVTIQDAKANEGNDLKLRVGERIFPNFFTGYEYYYSNYKYVSKEYYSPQNFESHALWGDWTVEESDEYEIIAGGRLGYVPNSKFFLREIYGRAQFNLMKSLILSAGLTLGSTSRETNSYNYVSGLVTAYWNIY